MNKLRQWWRDIKTSVVLPLRSQFRSTYSAISAALRDEVAWTSLWVLLFQSALFLVCYWWFLASSLELKIAPWGIKGSPPPGLAVAALALVAVIMTVDEKPSMQKKVIWIVIAFGLFYVESRAIYQDRFENESRQDEETRISREQFANVLRQNQREFQATTEQNKEVFSKSKQAADTATEAVNTITGGRGFCYAIMGVDFQGNRMLDKTALFVTVAKTQILRNVTIRVVDRHAYLIDRSPRDNPVEFMTRHAKAMQLGDLTVGSKPIFADLGVNTDNHTNKDYGIEFSALNGQWVEDMHYKYLNGKMEQAIRVKRLTFVGADVRDRRETVIYTSVSSGYPKKNGKVDWSDYR